MRKVDFRKRAAEIVEEAKIKADQTLKPRYNSLLIQEPPLQVLPTLARIIGLNEAIVLQQAHYWLSRSRHMVDGRRWFYRTYEDWQTELPWWSTRTIKRVIASLEQRKLLISSNYNTMQIDRTKWYTIDYMAVEKLGA